MTHHTKQFRIEFIVVLLVSSFLAPQGSVMAHEGHGTEEVGAFDLDAPRVVSPQTAKHIGLETAEVDFQPIQDVVELSGIVKPQPNRQYSVVSLIEGQVIGVHVRVGDRVKTGQLLVELESLSYLERWSKLEMLHARIEALELERKAAQEQLDRTEKLAGKTIAARELAVRNAEVAKVKSSLKLALIEVRQVQSWLQAVTPSLDTSQPPHSRVVLKASGDGVVVQRLIKPRQWVEAGQSLLEVVDYSVVQIEGELPESLIARIRARQSDKVRVRTPSDPSFLGTGTVRYIAPELDPVKRTAHLIIDAPNPKGVLRGEMWVDLAIVLREVKEALVIPRKAVVVRGPMHFVFVQEADSYKKQDIVPGVTDDRFIEVKDGLGPGDIIVVQGAYSLTHLPPKAAAKPAQEASPEKSTNVNGKPYSSTR